MVVWARTRAGDTLPDGEDKMEGDRNSGGHVVVDGSLVLQLLELQESEGRLT